MKLIRAFTIAFFLVTGNALPAADTPFLGPIPVQYAATGKDVILDMHRFFHPAGSRLQIQPDPDVDLAFDAVSLQLRIHPRKTGLTDLVLTAGSGKETRKTVLTLAVSAGKGGGHRFTYKPPPDTVPPKKISVAGGFNGWNIDKTPLTGPNESGEYSAEVPLEPGKYGYKFVVDGKWIRDPANPDTEDNGMGDKNSVVTIGGSKDSAVSPIIYADKVDAKTLLVRSASPNSFAKASAVFETNSETFSVPTKISDGKIEIPLPPGKSGFVRVIAATTDGTPTNTIGCPVGNSEAFSWHDAVMYYAFTDRFSDGNLENDKPVDDARVQWPANFHGGDLAGVRKKIEEGYFEKLGINTIWIAPLNRNPKGAYQEFPEPHRWYTGYHGYWPVSSTELDPHLGSEADLQGVIDTAHARNMKVIADLVLHHVHTEHPWWKQHRDWFGVLELPDGRKNLRLWEEQQFTTWFEPYLPSFDFSKDAPVHALIDNSIWWLNRYKLDGFRLDAVKHIVPSFWWKFRAALREQVDRKRKVPLYLVGETFKDRAGIMSFVGPNMLDGQFDFPLYDQIKDTFGLAKDDMKALDDALSASEKMYGKETLMSPLVGNHDKGRFMAYADGDLPEGKKKEEEVGWTNPPKVDDPTNYSKLELAQAFLMSIDGVPMVYYGDEIGMTGAGDPDNRRDMRFGDQVTPDEQRLLDNFRKLGAIRNAHPALRYGSRRLLRADQDTYVFVRAHLDDRIVVAFNRRKGDATLDLQVSPELDDGDYVDALSGKKATVRDGKLALSLPGQTAAFIVRH